MIVTSYTLYTMWEHGFLPRFWQKMKNWLGKNEKFKNRGVEYEKSMFPHGIKCNMVVGPETLKLVSFSRKKSKKVQKVQVVEVRDMYLTVTHLLIGIKKLTIHAQP